MRFDIKTPNAPIGWVTFAPVAPAWRFTRPARAVKISRHIPNMESPPTIIGSVKVVSSNQSVGVIDCYDFVADFARFFAVFFRDARPAGADRDDFFFTGSALVSTT